MEEDDEVVEVKESGGETGASVNLNSVVEDTSNATYRTPVGDTIEADCHFLCTAKPLSTAWLRETLIKNHLNVVGRIKVDESLRVKGRSNIFAIGDITDVPVSANHNHPNNLQACYIKVSDFYFSQCL